MRFNLDTELIGSSPIGHVVPVRIHDRRFDQHFEHSAYVPDPLPEELNLSGNTWSAVTDAQAALARLDGAASEIPNPLLIVRPIIRREAVSTSALEGTYSPIEELLGAEAAREVGRAETGEVLNYVNAAERGLELLEKRPVSLNLINELHGILLRGVRGDSYEVGSVRTHQNWIGPEECRITESSFVPPPPETLGPAISAWEKWIHRDDLPLVVRVSLGHYQFETLHPYNDGNGRLGRLVVVLQLIEEDLLRDHLVSISPYLEGRRDEYIDQLRTLTITGDFDRWVSFFSAALQASAESSLTQIKTLEGIRDDAVRKLRQDGIKGSAVQIAEDIIGYPVMTVSDAAERHGVTYPAAKAAIEKLVERRILAAESEKTYNRLYYAPAVLQVLRAGRTSSSNGTIA